MNRVQSPVNIKAAAWTIGIHALLFLLFFMVKYSTPAVAAPEELGMEVNLGTSDDGSGEDQPMNTDALAASDASSSYTASASVPEEAKSIEPSDDPDAPAIASSAHLTATVSPATQNRPQTINRQPTSNQQDPAPAQRPRYVYAGSTGRGGNNAATNAAGAGEGNTTGSGDRGVPGGTPGADNYTGSPGNGTGGVSHTLNGRDISPRQFEAEFNEGGRVVIRVTVDRDGRIISKAVKSSPSAALTRIAMQKLAEAKFSSSKDAAPQQFGEITIVFKTRS